MADSVGHGEHGQAECKRHTEKTDPEIREARGDDGAAAAAEGESKRVSRVAPALNGRCPRVRAGRLWSCDEFVDQPAYNDYYLMRDASKKALASAFPLPL
jgi:hypothetical protein